MRKGLGHSLPAHINNHNDKAAHGKTFYITLGKDIPEIFVPSNKENFIFQCSRHDSIMNTIEVAKNCLKYKIKGYFAGPIFNNYNLMDYIDNENTFYLGNISEEKKLDYTKRAKLYTLLIQNWTPPFNQSAIEALSMGTPVLANEIGFLSKIIKDKKNGFIFNNNFLECFQAAKDIDQQKCYDSVSNYTYVNMIKSFYSAFEKILKDWRR